MPLAAKTYHLKNIILYKFSIGIKVYCIIILIVRIEHLNDNSD